MHIRRLEKRAAVKQRNLPARAAIGRRWMLQPDLSKPFWVELFISPNRRHMHRVIGLKCGRDEGDPRCSGLVRHYFSKATGRYVVRPRQIIASMFLNADDMRATPGEIIAHECAHAGMAWARLRKANLSVMDGEEVLCYAVGVLVPQVNRIGYAMGIWK